MNVLQYKRNGKRLNISRKPLTAVVNLLPRCVVIILVTRYEAYLFTKTPTTLRTPQVIIINKTVNFAIWTLHFLLLGQEIFISCDAYPCAKYREQLDQLLPETDRLTTHHLSLQQPCVQASPLLRQCIWKHLCLHD